MILRRAGCSAPRSLNNTNSSRTFSHAASRSNSASSKSLPSSRQYARKFQLSSTQRSTTAVHQAKASTHSTPSSLFQSHPPFLSRFSQHNLPSLSTKPLHIHQSALKSATWLSSRCFVEKGKDGDALDELDAGPSSEVREISGDMKDFDQQLKESLGNFEGEGKEEEYEEIDDIPDFLDTPEVLARVERYKQSGTPANAMDAWPFDYPKMDADDRGELEELSDGMRMSYELFPSENVLGAEIQYAMRTYDKKKAEIDEQIKQLEFEEMDLDDTWERYTGPLQQLLNKKGYKLNLSLLEKDIDWMILEATKTDKFNSEFAAQAFNKFSESLRRQINKSQKNAVPPTYEEMSKIVNDLDAWSESGQKFKEFAQAVIDFHFGQNNVTEEQLDTLFKAPDARLKDPKTFSQREFFLLQPILDSSEAPERFTDEESKQIESDPLYRETEKAVNLKLAREDIAQRANFYPKDQDLLALLKSDDNSVAADYAAYLRKQGYIREIEDPDPLSLAYQEDDIHVEKGIRTASLNMPQAQQVGAKASEANRPVINHPEDDEVGLHHDDSLGAGKESDNLDDGGSEGAPQKIHWYDPSFDEVAPIQYLLRVRRHTKITSGGRVYSYSALVIIGNGRGTVGLGYGRGTEADDAAVRARRSAYYNVFTFERHENRTIPTSKIGRWNATKVILTTRPKGYGPQCHPKMMTLLNLLGLEDVSLSIMGRRHVVHVYRALMIALKQVENIYEIGRQTGQIVYNVNRYERPQLPYGGP